LSALSHRDEPVALPANRRLLVSHAGLKRGTLWLLGASSGFALIEPSPYEIVFLLTMLVFALTGLRLSQRLLPMALLLLLYNIGGVIALIPWMDEPPSVRFTAVSVYLMITAIFLAAIMAEDAVARIETLIRSRAFSAISTLPGWAASSPSTTAPRGPSRTRTCWVPISWCRWSSCCSMC
jgi:hypothetical protein